MDANITTNNNKPSLIIWLILGLIFALIVLNGCTPKIQTIYVDRWHVKDSIAYDSVYIERIDTIKTETKGDSVFITKIKYQDKYKVKIQKVFQKDTVSKVVEKPVTKIKEVKVRDLVWWLGMGGILFAAYKFIRFLLRFIK